MDAIEIYQKVLEVVKDQEFNEVSMALQFVTRKIENDYYSKQKGAGIYGGSLLGANACGSQYNPHAEAIAIVRQAVREELAEKDKDASPDAKQEAA